MTEVLALDVGWGTTLALKTIIILALVPAGALVLGYTFLLKMMSHMQSRLGPMDPGGFHGWFQLVGDGIKFIQKEDVMPDGADRRVFAMAPAVIVMSTFLIFVVLPAGPRLIVSDLNVGVFYALAVSSLSVIGVLMAAGPARTSSRSSARSGPPPSSSRTSSRSCSRSSAWWCRRVR
jgi:NADH-quinone oxidoreductase subunit H